MALRHRRAWQDKVLPNLTHYPRDLESLIVKDKRTLKKIKGAIIRKAVRLDKAK